MLVIEFHAITATLEEDVHIFSLLDPQYLINRLGRGIQDRPPYALYPGFELEEMVLVEQIPPSPVAQVSSAHLGALPHSLLEPYAYLQ